MFLYMLTFTNPVNFGPDPPSNWRKFPQIFAKTVTSGPFEWSPRTERTHESVLGANR
jgi:hypothetical protein